MKGQISDPCQAQFWVKHTKPPPEEPDAEDRESPVMGSWGGDESDGSRDLEIVQAMETMEAMILVGPAFSGDDRCPLSTYTLLVRLGLAFVLRTRLCRQ